MSLTCLFKFKTSGWNLTVGILGFERFGIPLWPPLILIGFPTSCKNLRGRSPGTCPEHYPIWIQFWDATVGHWKLDWKRDSVKGKANDCNIKAAARSNFLKQKYVLGSISQKVVRKPSICLSYKFALIPFNVLNIQQALATQKDLFELARLRKKDTSWK